MVTHKRASLWQCWCRFCHSRDVMLLPLLAGVGVIAAQHTDTPLRMALGAAVGLGVYRLLERYFHEQMHLDKVSPFWVSHNAHHEDPTPESGCPHYWLFGVYWLITVTVYLLALPFLSGVWAGVLLMLFAYEWFHFLCHCRQYRPLTRYGWRIRVNHLIHHNLDPNGHYELLFPKKRHASTKEA